MPKFRLTPATALPKLKAFRRLAPPRWRFVSSALLLGITIACHDTPLEPFDSSASPRSAVSPAIVSATDLGTLGGSNSEAHAINPAGQIVGGSALSGDTEYHAFLWDKGTMTDLGTLGGTYSIAYGINPQGQVVGGSATSANYMHAFLWENGTMTDLGTLGGSGSTAYGINPQGQVVGEFSRGLGHAFLWENGTMTDLGTLGGPGSGATGINPQGQVVGYSYTGGNPLIRGFVWDKGTMTALSSLGGNSYASAINAQGQVVGFSYDGNNIYHAVLWDKGTIINLGAGDFSQANAINPQGQVVGQSGSGGGAFLWSNGTLTALGTLGGPAFFGSWAYGISPGGEIVGGSLTTGFAWHATLWTVK